MNRGRGHRDSTLLTADLGPVKIQHPENWAGHSNQAAGTIRHHRSPGRSRDQWRVYGVLLNRVEAPQGERMSIDDVTSRLVQAMQQAANNAEAKEQLAF